MGRFHSLAILITLDHTYIFGRSAQLLGRAGAYAQSSPSPIAACATPLCGSCASDVPAAEANIAIARHRGDRTRSRKRHDHLDGSIRTRGLRNRVRTYKQRPHKKQRLEQAIVKPRPNPAFLPWSAAL